MYFIIQNILLLHSSKEEELLSSSIKSQNSLINQNENKTYPDKNIKKNTEKKK